MNIQSFQIDQASPYPILCDIRFPELAEKVPVIIFVHGFKAFKDWGHFNVIANTLCEAGFAVLKFSFSHGGTTPEQPEDFADLEAFGKNTFTQELNDLGTVIDWLHSTHAYTAAINLDQIFLIGHSRGGGIAILKAAEDARIKKLVTWAAVSNFETRVNPPALERWRTEGVMYVPNARTQQQMPMYYSLREDYYANEKRLHIPNAARRLQQPFLIIHGTADEAVPMREAQYLKDWCKHAQLVMVEGAMHTFGGKHPFEGEVLPEFSIGLVKQTIHFLL
ncbi:MAG: alpha/beta hydrolase family protein [Bacteroidia bacterium]